MVVIEQDIPYMVLGTRIRLRMFGVRRFIVMMMVLRTIMIIIRWFSFGKVLLLKCRCE